MAKKNNNLIYSYPNIYNIGGALLGAGIGALAPTVVNLGKRLLFGNVNQELVSQIQNSNAQLAGLQVASGNLDSLQNQWGSTNFGTNFSKSDIGSDGLFSHKASNTYNRLVQQQNAARQSALQVLNQAAASTENQLDANIIANTMAEGGSIHIKPSKRGTFTAAASKRGKSVQEFASQVLANKENYTPAMVKKANFARNASKWKHADGGPIFNPFTKTWYANDGKTKIGSRHKHDFGYTEYTKDGFAVNYTPEGREINRRKGKQTPHISGKGRNAQEQAYFDTDKVFTDSARVKAKRYGLNPNVLASRLARENVDGAIAEYNRSGGKSLISAYNDEVWGSEWGLDHFGSNVRQGFTTLKEPWITWEDEDFVNEKGIPTQSAYFPGGWSDAMSGVAAELKGRRDRIAKKFPKLTQDELDIAALAAYNQGEQKTINDIKSKGIKSISRYKPFINIKALGGDLNNDFSNGVTYIGNGGSHEENPFEGIQFGIDENGTPNLVEEGEVIFNDYVYSDRLKVPKGVKDKYKLGNNKNMTFAQAAKKISKESEERPNDPLSKASLEIGLARLAQEQEALKEEQNMQQNNKYAKGGDLRYAPVIGNAIGLVSNLFSKPDYSRANAIEKAARIAGTYTPVSYTPIGTKLSFTPSDRNWQINKLQSQNAAARSALRNSISPSTNAALLAADYNAGVELGDLMEKAQRYDQEQRERVATFNRQTDITNSELGLRTAMANQQAQQSANQIRLSGITQAMNMRDEIDARRSAALSSNLSGLATSLGNIGIDWYNRRQAGLAQLNSGIPLTTKPDGVTQKEWDEYLGKLNSHPEWFNSNNSSTSSLSLYKDPRYKFDTKYSLWLNTNFNNPLNT